MILPEPEVLIARRAFPDAQAAMEGVGVAFSDSLYTVSWKGTVLADQLGSFCVVNPNGPLAELVGDFLRFRLDFVSVLAYCVASSEVPYDAAVTKRVFAAVSSLAVDSIEVSVEVIQ